MGKKILILTAGKTGGHRSASNALTSALKELDPSIEILDYDSNQLFLGYRGEGGEQGYVTMTTRFRFVWKVFFEFTSFFRGISNFFLHEAIKHRFRHLLRDERPDLIVSLHPCFVGSAIRVMKKVHKVPFYVVVLDPIKQSRLWLDKRADLNFLPTKETKELFLRKGFKSEQLIQTGFPLSPLPKVEVAKSSRKKLLFVNPSQRSLRHCLKLIKVAFDYDVDIDIITGSDNNLRKYLEKKLPKKDGVHIYGYVNDMAVRLQRADILLTKAGPNIIFEAIAANIPLILTGHLPGQEEKNADYVTSRGYGYKAEKPAILRSTLQKLLVDEPELLPSIKEKMASCEDLDGAKNIAIEIVKRL